VASDQRVTVIKLDHRAQERWRYEGLVLAREPLSITIEARFNTPDKLLPGLSLRTGDRFVETHYADRWYNTFAVYDGTSGEHKGWYCNITRPARIESDRVSAEDLALDLIVRRDGSWIVLDELEFEAQELSAAERENALAALAELKELAQQLEGPFRSV
jgi:predicted RNA-binding protein associated with RNAse of E/G family